MTATRAKQARLRPGPSAMPDEAAGGRWLDLEGLRSVRLRPAGVRDASAIARLHTEVLPGAFLPLMGPRFLRVLFRAHVTDPGGVAVVAERDGEVIGYACGVLSMPEFRRRLVLRDAVPLSVAMLPQLRRPAVLRRLFETAGYPEKTKGLPDAEWDFVGVKRGTAPGLGVELGREVLSRLGRLGAREVKGYVACDNRAMNRMVRRMGFELRTEISLHDGRPSNVYVIRVRPDGDAAEHPPTSAARPAAESIPARATGTAPRPPAGGRPETATHVDERTGARAHATFFGDGPARMLGVLHTPREAAVAGVVVCSPIGAEFLRSHRREVLLSRSLAASGIAVQRFHYRGAGSSDGEAEDLTFDSMLEDAEAATALLRERTGVDRVAFVGTRLGGCVAAALAARSPGSPLALWEPALDGSQYLEEVFRARLIQGLRDESVPDEAPGDPAEELRTNGVVDVLGHPITAAFYESARGRTLVGSLGQGPRPVLLAQVGRRPRLRRDYATLAERWRKEGLDVETQVFVQPHEAWWFATPDESAPPGARMALQRPLLEATEAWLRRRLGQEASP